MNTGFSRALRLGIVAVVISGSAGCGSSPDEPGQAGPAAAGGEEGQEPAVVQVGAIPVTDTAVMMLGEEQGFFAEQGIDPEIQFSGGGAEVLPALISGEYQLGYSNTISIFQARERGLPVCILGVSSATHADPELGTNDLIIRGDSTLESPADLEGKRVGVNTLGNFSEILARIAVDNAGGNSDNVQFVELSFPDLIPALESGNIDAFVSGEPFRTIALGAGHQILVNPHQEMSPRDSFIIGGWFTTEDAVRADPELFANLRTAIDESNAYATEHSEEMRALIPEYTNMDPALTEQINLSNYPNELAVEDLRPMADAAVEYGILESMPDFEELLCDV